MLAAGIDPLATAVPAVRPASDPRRSLARRPAGFLWLGLVAVLALPLGTGRRVAASGSWPAGDPRLALVSLPCSLVVLGSIVAADRLEG